MYVTARRVRSLGKSVSQGINAFLHKHDDDGSLDWNNPDIRRIAETKTGTLVAKHIEVRPGMNRVLSYLDVATKDDSKQIAIAALDTFESRISTDLPIVQVIDHVAIRFDAQVGLPLPELLEEFNELKKRVVDLVGP